MYINLCICIYIYICQSGNVIPPIRRSCRGVKRHRSVMRILGTWKSILYELRTRGNRVHGAGGSRMHMLRGCPKGLSMQVDPGERAPQSSAVAAAAARNREPPSLTPRVSKSINNLYHLVHSTWKGPICTCVALQIWDLHFASAAMLLLFLLLQSNLDTTKS